MSDESKTWLDVMLAAFSAFLGAWAAFKLEAHRQEVRERRQRLDAVRAALFALAMQRTFMRNLEAQFLSPVRASPLRAYLMLPIDAATTASQLDLASLGFLLGTGGGQLLNEIENADLRFRTLLSVLARRNSAHLEMQARLETEPGDTTGGTLADLRRLVGPRRARALETATDQLYETLDGALDRNRTTHAKLEEHARSAFPKDKVFKVEELPLPLPPSPVAA